MLLLSWFRPPRRLLLFFLVVTLVPAIGLIWMGWSLFEQDRALADTRLRERREQAADLAVTILRQRLSEAEQVLTNSSFSNDFAPGDDALVVVLEPGRIEAYPKDRLLYYPSLPPQPEAPDGWFQSGERLENQFRDYAGAMASYRELLGNADAAVRAGAHLRIARCLRSAGQLDAALAEYKESSRFEGVAYYGVPATLRAAQARCAILAKLNRQDELKQEATALYADLCRGRWRINQAVYQVHAREIAEWTHVDRSLEQERLALAGGVDWLWERWLSMTQGGVRAAGRQSFEIEGHPVTLLWKAASQRLTALIAGPQYLEQHCFAPVRPILEGQGVRIAFKTSDGGTLVGAPGPSEEPQTQRTAAETGLPWTLSFASTHPQEDMDGLANRRRRLLAGLAMVLILVGAGSYAVARAFLRELAAVQLQVSNTSSNH